MSELFDKRGVPIEPGDLLKTFHFRDRRGRRYYLYHTVVREDRWLRMVPTSHLEPKLRNQGGSCLLNQEMADNAEVVSGHGPGDCLDFNDRPRRKIPDPAPR